MRIERVRILNFDASLSQQHKILERFHPEIIDLRSFSSLARLWLNKRTEKALKKSLPSNPQNSINFLGSGDFHHISSLLIEQLRDPITVIVFDSHPDWDTLPPKTGCGSWVSRILKYPGVKNVILLGISSDDISTFNIQSANLKSLSQNRLEIYPYAHQETKVFFRGVPQNVSIEVKRGIFSKEISWNELKGKDLAKFLPGVLQRLNTKNVYISIDKDCLKPEYSLTNWEKGKMTLDELLLMLRIIKENCHIVAADIVGDYSKINIQGRIKAICSRLDHPADYSALAHPEAVINSVNAETNIKILDLLAS